MGIWFFYMSDFQIFDIQKLPSLFQPHFYFSNFFVFQRISEKYNKFINFSHKNKNFYDLSFLISSSSFSLISLTSLKFFSIFSLILSKYLGTVPYPFLLTNSFSAGKLFPPFPEIIKSKRFFFYLLFKSLFSTFIFMKFLFGSNLRNGRSLCLGTFSLGLSFLTAITLE